MPGTICYVDGLNLYYGLKKDEWREYLWLDIPALAQAVLQRLRWKEPLSAVKYFTTPMLSDPGRAKRQSTYISALETNPLVSVHLGTMRKTTEYCPLCHRPYDDMHEKETDTGISAEIVKDAAKEEPRGVLLIAGDTDYTPTFRVVKQYFPEITTLLAKPPNRGPCDSLRSFCDRYMVIKRDLLASCQFPETVQASSGLVLSRPPNFHRKA